MSSPLTVSLATGTRVGPYEITGMGEVYRAVAEGERGSESRRPVGARPHPAAEFSAPSISGLERLWVAGAGHGVSRVVSRGAVTLVPSTG